MASDTDDTAVTEFTEENVEQTGLSGVEKKKETDILCYYRKRSESVPKKQKSRNSDMSWKEFVLKIPSYRKPLKSRKLSKKKY